MARSCVPQRLHFRTLKAAKHGGVLKLCPDIYHTNSVLAVPSALDSFHYIPHFFSLLRGKPASGNGGVISLQLHEYN